MMEASCAWKEATGDISGAGGGGPGGAGGLGSSQVLELDPGSKVSPAAELRLLKSRDTNPEVNPKNGGKQAGVRMRDVQSGTFCSVTEELVRRRAEHNENQMWSLEELSLHQQDLEGIQHLDRWCRDLRILYLQNNLIARIENLGRLKKLQYLNLALNNIEVIENLEGCESLVKLDLTVNFVGLLSSVETLRQNLQLRDLFLLGNPCSAFQGYRAFVVAALPQLQRLDDAAISRAERIRALQDQAQVRQQVQQQEAEHQSRRAAERAAAPRRATRDGRPDSDRSPEEEEEEEEEEQTEEEFWGTPCPYTPESRLEAHRRLERTRRGTAKEPEKRPGAPGAPRAPRTLVSSDGRVWNVNEPKLDFSLTENPEDNTIVLDLSVYRHLDTSLLDVDVQPTYARVSVKGKVFQLVLPGEVRPDGSTARRSESSGHLVLTMPRADGELRGTSARRPPPRAPLNTLRRRRSPQDHNRKEKVPERLEAGPSRTPVLDLLDLGSHREESRTTAAPAHCSEGFEDDPDVPPLI